VLVDHHLSGIMVGQTLDTTCVDQYRALLEATAFGTRMIVETFQRSGVPVEELVVAGGLIKNPLLMQIYADVTGLPLSCVTSTQAPALGAAIHAAAAAGEYRDVPTASARMGGRTKNAFTPIPENVTRYNALYAAYVELHDWFGRNNPLMRRLRVMRSNAERRETVGSAQ
jgi:L-ribulokinase